MVKTKDLRGSHQKHKGANTFKFKSFNTWVAEVSVDIRTQLNGPVWRPGGDESYFYEAFSKWTDLNRTQHFSDFQNAVRGKTQSYPLIVFNKDTIVQCLNQHLAVPGNLALEPLLDLVLNLAKDLQGDFYPYFPVILQTFLDLVISNQDVEILEWTFSCLSHLFRILRRQMMKDWQSVFRLMIPLFDGNNKDYIIRFATESFAFVVRDCKDHAQIIDYLFSYCRSPSNSSTIRDDNGCLTLDAQNTDNTGPKNIETPDLSAAVGELLFETVKNVNHHLHSAFEKIYPVFLDKLREKERDETVDYDAIERCVSSMTDFLLNHITRETSQAFWMVFLKTIEKQEETISRFHSVILNKCCVAKNGWLILDGSRTMAAVSTYIISCKSGWSDGTSSRMATTAAALLQCEHLDFEMKLAARMKLIRNVFASAMSLESKLLLAEQLHQLVNYHVELLPSLLEVSLKEYSNNLDHILVALITLILNKDSEHFNSSDGTAWQPFKMDFGSKNAEQVSLFCEAIFVAAKDHPEDHISRWTYLWTMAVLAPHISPALPVSVTHQIKSSLDAAIVLLQHADIDNTLGRVLSQVIHASVIALIASKQYKFDEARTLATLIPCLRNFAHDVSLLSAVEAVLTRQHTSSLTLPTNVESTLRQNLRDKEHAVRRVTLRILDRSCSSAFIEGMDTQQSAYQVCLLAELVEPSVHDYREKLRYLRMLDCSRLDQLTTDASVPLLYLFGSLKIGFKLLWKEIRQIITTYRSFFTLEKLWPLVESELRLVSQEAESSNGEHKPQKIAAVGLPALLQSEYEDLSRSDSNPLNAHQYRMQLWETFGDVVGSDSTRNRIFSELFQRFMRNEFIPTTFLYTTSDEMIDDSSASVSSTRKSRADAEATVCAMLDLLSKLHNPAALLHDPLIRGYISDLLTYRSEKVQTAALRLLFNYKLEYIRPYEEHLMKLLDENQIWNTLTEMEFGAEKPLVQEVHRPLLVPVVIRILFGRLQAKNKTRNTEKAAPKGRKEAIVRTLANCRPEEFRVFVDLALKPCGALLDGDLEESIRRILTGGKLPAVNLKLADGVIQVLFAIVDELRAGSDHCIHTIFRVVLGILAVVAKMRSAMQKSHPSQSAGNSASELPNGRDEESDDTGNHLAKPDGLIKRLRKECYRCLAKICDVFPASTFSDVEQQLLLDVAIAPEMDNLIRDGPFTVTPMMRMILAWSSSITYHHLLVISMPNQIKSPLSLLTEILNPDLGSNTASVNLVMQVLDNILYPENLTDPTHIVVPATRPSSLSHEQRKSVLTPFAGQILRYFHNKLSHFQAKKKQTSSPLTATELRIASGMSDLALDSEHSLSLLDLILPLLATSEMKRSSDLLGLLEIVQNLISRVAVSVLEKKVLQLIPLFSKEFSREPRLLLGRILSDISHRTTSVSFKPLSDTASNLLSWDERHLDQPDYDRRGTAYRQSRQHILNGQMADGLTSFSLLVLHMADYDIRKATDMISSSLRDMGLDCIIAIIRRFSETPDETVILSHLIPLLKAGMKSREESVRNAFVNLMGEIVDFYPNHALFRDLAFLRYAANKKAVNAEKCKYCNSEGVISKEFVVDQQAGAPKQRCRCYNNDQDVFDNLRHMQKHRVGSALHDLARWTSDKTMPVSTVLQYFLPFATVHLCNEQYIGEKHQGLINAVIELVQAVCSQLTWAKYEPMLKHFLNLMARKSTYQRQLIRVVVAVVDAFHFDLSGIDFKAVKFPTKKIVQQPETQPDPSMGEMVDEEDVEKPDDEVADAVTVAAKEVTEVLATSDAKKEKIYRALTQFMIPGLMKLMTDKAEGDDSHKLAANIHAGERDEILRAPVSLAIVKLLQKLPPAVLRRQIPAVFLKISRLLKSRLLSVRQSTRETLSEIMIALGPTFLPTLIKELRGVLKRGYQIHVLVHCVHTILTKLLPVLKSGSLDRCVTDLVQICHEEMFGELAEEKEVTALTRKIAEAKSIKSYDTYAILASFASPGILVKMIKPLKEKAEESQSKKVAVKLEKALRQILSGLAKNEQLTEKDLLLFSYALYDQSMGIFGVPKPKVEKEQLNPSLTRPDSYLITPEPGRGGTAPATNRHTNDYLVQNFGLQILLSCFRNSRLHANQPDHMDMLDPFVPVVLNCLTSRDMPVKTSALRCLIWMFKFKLPALEQDMDRVVKMLFVHLKNYSGPGAALSENAEFVNAVYKALSSTVQLASTVTISNKHLKVLLTYAESDLREGTKQILAFNLLKAILSRHLLCPELREIMVDLAKTSIQGTEENLRQQSRHLVGLFLTTYKWRMIKGKEFEELYMDNLEYPQEHGRLVCITVLADLLEKMDTGFYKDSDILSYFQVFAARLSDESSSVRHKAAASITSIVKKASGSTLVGDIFKWIQRWLTDDDVAIRRIGFQTASLFVQVEKVKFLPRLDLVLGVLSKLIKQRQIPSSEDALLELDHLLINALSLLANLIDNCGVEIWTSVSATKKLTGIFNSVRELLLHEHEWVRIGSLEAFWRLFEQQPPENLSQNALFRDNPLKKVSLLAGVLIHQLKSYSDRSDYYDMWSKCLTYVSQAIVILSPDVIETAVENGDAKSEEDMEDLKVVPVDRLVSLPYTVRGVCREAVFEALREPKQTIKRLQVMKWIKDLVDVFEANTYAAFLHHVLPVLYRCSNEPSAQKDESLKQMTEETIAAVEGHVGREVYSDAMRSVIIQFSKKRAERKRQQAVEPILNPEKAARKKMKKHQTKKDVRKRKHHDLETGRLVKKIRP